MSVCVFVYHVYVCLFAPLIAVYRCVSASAGTERSLQFITKIRELVTVATAGLSFVIYVSTVCGCHTSVSYIIVSFAPNSIMALS